MNHRYLTTGLAVSALTLALAAPRATAHVTIEPGEAPQGGFATLTFRVPNEHDTASTTQVEVNLPSDTPIPSVAVQPKPGWTYELELTALDEPVALGDQEVTEVVSTITWTGGRIAPGEFEQFAVALGPLPADADQVVFPAQQTYDSGEVVRWVDEPADHGEEPAFPAPMVRLVAGSDDDHGATGSESEPESGETGGLTVENAASQDDLDGANALGAAGVVVGVVALITAGTALVLLRRRRA